MEFENLCFVDTLDNTAPLGHRIGHQQDLFASFSEENVKRVKRQNAKKISVVIGNPPYNANQQNENDNNKNREYPKIDELIKASYIKASTAQKTKLYDMYARFFRWASDRLDINGDGIVAFITNHSFINSRTFDGFRKTISKEFNDIWIVDLGGDVRLNPKLSGTRHNVFGIQIGVAISFMVRKKGAKGCNIHYTRRPEYETREDKLAFLSSSGIDRLSFQALHLDKRNSLVDNEENDFGDFIAIADRQTMATSTRGQDRAIFKLFSLGVSTNRDAWLYDMDRGRLSSKARQLVETYSKLPPSTEDFPNTIKWSRNLKRCLKGGQREPFDASRIVRAIYRPFSHLWLYQSPLFVDEMGRMDRIFVPGGSNRAICFTDPTAQKPWLTCAVSSVPDLHFVGAAAGAVCLARYSIALDGSSTDNITDWALNKFREKYQKGNGRRAVGKDDIFHYVYALLHDPIYREKYTVNLKQEFPRIPLYADFWRWVEWGQKLMVLHVNYDQAKPFALARTDRSDEKARKAGVSPKVMLSSDREKGEIAIDSETALSGVPSNAWTYMLGNRSAIDWVLDQHKEKAPKDPTIREKFNTYRFADHREKVVDLLKRVTTVSVETMQIVEAMRAVPRIKGGASD